ncbi:MAG: tetratricopeptide repeat protein [Marinilabiliaceae bacterium]|nr:tetratricopeptide repeat protein [Marinilabiliaceae bacterium]
MIKLITCFLISIIFISYTNILAQKSIWSQSFEKEYIEAIDLYEHEQYGSALIAFKNIAANKHNIQSNWISDAAFMSAKCADELNNDDALFLFEEFIATYPESNKIPYAYFHSGEIMQDEEKFRQAVRLYENVDHSGLNQESKYKYWFKYGYCLFMTDDYDNATTYFLKLKDIETKYHLPTNYYYAHIQYSKGNYDTALKGFIKLEKNDAFTNIVPYYIAQIYYLQQNYDKAIEYATPLLTTGSKQRQADMARIVGNAWFAKKEYSKATPYFQQAINNSSTPLREDFYHMGFCYYYQKDYSNAADLLSKVTSNEDTLSQNAYYHLGDCFIKLGDKKRARVAFEAASKYDFDKTIQEDALMNYLKLNYQMAYSPFNEIINSFLRFIELFPNSDKIDQAYEYLGKAFLTTKNYKQALESMEKINKKDVNVYRAMQRIAYYRGLELFTASQFQEAIKFLSQSIKYAEYDKSIKIKTYYWRGEAFYRTNDYEKAKTDYNEFLMNPGSYKMDEFSIAHYNMGYINFKQKDYNEAANWFKKYLRLTKDPKNDITADTYNRLGDCYYVERQFETAISNYDKSIFLNTGTPDYALYQKAFCLGLMKNHTEKISILKSLSLKYPKSSYIDDALYETGRSYVAINDLTNAIYNYKTLKEKYPKSSYAKKAMLQLGLVYYNSNELENSMSFYKRVVNEYPGTQESEDALLGIKNIYMDQSNPEGYIKYTETLGTFAKLDIKEQDSLTFESAQRFYMNGDCLHAIAHFENYLTTFPDGRYAINAQFYKGDCFYKQNNYREAVKSFDAVASMPRNQFTEKALIHSGEIHFMNQNYYKALNNFNILNEIAEIDENKMEARIGILRCLVKLENYDEIIESSNQLLKTPKIAPEIERECKFALAKAYLTKNKTDEALLILKELAKNSKSKEGAESKYLVAQIFFDQGKYDNAEKEIFNFADMGTSYQYWLARSFILLSDIYIIRDELFQAQQYLESIIENYSDNDDIIPMTNERLRSIKSKNANQKQSENQIEL